MAFFAVNFTEVASIGWVEEPLSPSKQWTRATGCETTFYNRHLS